MAKRFYSFAIVSYADLKDIQPLLNNANHWAYILHDKDNAPKHYHIIATFQQNKSYNVVRGYVQSNQTTLCEELDSAQATLRYWTHIDYPEKAQYPKTDIVYDNEMYWSRYDDRNANDTNTAFIEDLINDDLTEYDRALKWGRDYIKNRGVYQQFRATLKTEMFRELEKATERLDVETGVLNQKMIHYNLDVEESILINYIRDNGIDISKILKEIKNETYRR